MLSPNLLIQTDLEKGLLLGFGVVFHLLYICIVLCYTAIKNITEVEI